MIHAEEAKNSCCSIENFKNAERQKINILIQEAVRNKKKRVNCVEINFNENIMLLKDLTYNIVYDHSCGDSCYFNISWP